MNSEKTESNLNWLIGETLTSITCSYNTVNLTDSNNKKYVLCDNEIFADCCNDYPDCCCDDCPPDVSIDDVDGDLKDLIGETIISAEEAITGSDIKFYNPESPTATYHIATKKGAVDIIFYKASTNEYGAQVNFYKLN